MPAQFIREEIAGLTAATARAFRYHGQERKWAEQERK